MGTDVHLRDLRYFVTVAEERSFTRAATERLFISQPALSKQIRQLESRLRAELFARSPRSVTLTAAGAALLPRARLLLAEWEEAFGEVRDVADAEIRTLTVGLHTRVGARLAPGVELALGERLPGWQVQFRQVRWEDPAVGLVGELVDVAIAWLPVPDGNGLSARILGTEQRWVALPAAHRLAAQLEVGFAELVDEPFVALPASAGPMRDHWLATAQRTSPPDIATEAHSVEETYEAVAAGVGVALLSATTAATYHRSGVVHRPVPDLPPSELAVLWRSADRRPGVRVVVEACCRIGYP